MKTQLYVIAVLMFMAISSCTVTMQDGPPPRVVEVVPAQPTVVHVWVPGYYRVQRGHYVWVPGYYRVPPRRHPVWVAPRYQPVPHGYRYRPGQWRRR